MEKFNKHRSFKKHSSCRIKKNWIYFQKKTFSYIEADKEKQKIFQEELSKIAPGNIVYSDETGIDDNEVRKTGWSKKGKRCYAQKKSRTNDSI